MNTHFVNRNIYMLIIHAFLCHIQCSYIKGQVKEGRSNPLLPVSTKEQSTVVVLFSNIPFTILNIKWSNNIGYEIVVLSSNEKYP